MRIVGSGSSGSLPSDGTVHSLTVTDHLGVNIASPAVGGDGEARLYARNIGGREMLAQIGGDPGALSRLLASSTMCCSVASITPGRVATVSAFGCQVSSAGTVSHPDIAAGSLLSETRRIRVASAATANSPAQLTAAPNLMYVSRSQGRGGFTVGIRFAVSVPSSQCRGFFGIYTNTVIAGTTSPQQLQNAIGVQWESGETGLSIGTNAGSGNATRSPLGAQFVTNDPNALYTLYLHHDPGAPAVGYTVMRHDGTPVSVTGYLSSNLPNESVMLTANCYMNNGGVAESCAFDCCFMTSEVPLITI